MPLTQEEIRIRNRGYCRKYAEANRQYIRARCRAYSRQPKNKERIKKYSDQYYLDNKEYILAKRKVHDTINYEVRQEYYNNNRERILAQKKEKRFNITCECGSTLCNTSLNLHLKSKKHLKLLEKV